MRRAATSFNETIGARLSTERPCVRRLTVGAFELWFTIAGMGWHHGAELARTIRARAYAFGEVKKAEARLTKLGNEAKAAEKVRADAMAKVAALDEEIAHRWKVDPDRIRPINRTPRRLIKRHGSLTSEILDYMGSFKRAVTTIELTEHLTRVLALPSDTAEEREESRRTIRHRLRHLVDDGWIQRLHKRETNGIGKWALVKQPPKKSSQSQR